jgi:hypothetical protein
MSSKEFLLQECSNLRNVLEETLRYKYGLDGSAGFFEECEVRREFLELEINNTVDTDHVTLDTNGKLLNELSGLVSRIERSSLGEYSWPFVEELKKIASAICTEATLANNNTPPMVYVFSDGGLDAYRIYPERKRPSASKQRILTIVFPRTLKHFVLLHPILGHEIGHAIWRSSKHQNALRTIVEEELVDSGGRFNNSDVTANWIYRQNPPAIVSQILNDLIAQGITEQLFFKWASWDAWKEEILCDLIGLVIFGPSFVAAHSELLYALCPSGAVLGRGHPPVGCRVNMIIQAARLLNFTDTTNIPAGNLKAAVTSFWQDMNGRRQADPWYEIFSDEQLRKALERISSLLGTYPPAQYPAPTDVVMDRLVGQITRQVPPIGFNMNDSGGICHFVDFRHILYSGWLSKQSIHDMPFLDLNRLCEHAIMQQRGIDQFLRETENNASAVA